MSTDVDDPKSGLLPGRIVHVHIPKTAGTALSKAFQQACGNRLRVYPIQSESAYGEIGYSGFNFYGGHIGFKVASEIGGDFITVLRDPVDRFVSTYFFLRQLYSSGSEINHKTFLTAKYDLDQFVMIRDEPMLQKELLNRMTWQIAYSHRLELRQDLIDAGVGDDDLVRKAISNLGRFAIVGIQTDMAGLIDAILRRYAIRLSIDRINITSSRLAKTDIASKTLKQIEQWVYLDIELYRAWISRMHPVDVSERIEATN